MVCRAAERVPPKTKQNIVGDSPRSLPSSFTAGSVIVYPCFGIPAIVFRAGPSNEDPPQAILSPPARVPGLCFLYIVNDTRNSNSQSSFHRAAEELMKKDRRSLLFKPELFSDLPEAVAGSVHSALMPHGRFRALLCTESLSAVCTKRWARTWGRLVRYS